MTLSPEQRGARLGGRLSTGLRLTAHGDGNLSRRGKLLRRLSSGVHRVTTLTLALALALTLTLTLSYSGASPVVFIE